MAGTTVEVRATGRNADSDVDALADQSNNQITDLETLRAFAAQVGTLIEELHDDRGTVNTWEIEVDADLDDINDAIHHRWNRDGVNGGGHFVKEGVADTTKVRVDGTCRYGMSGVAYSATNVEVELATGEITQAKYGAWRLTLDKLGVLSTQRATADGTSGTMAFDSEEDALLSLAQIARPADTVDVGYLAILAASGGFTPGTDLPIIGDAKVDGINFFHATAPRLDNGFTAAPSVGLSAGTTPEEFAFGTINVRTNGKNVAQISADVTIVFPEADVITTSGNYGGHIFVTNVAGTGIIPLSQTGIAGSAQTVDSASSAVVQTALDLLYLSLPTIFTIIGQEITLANKATFTYATDDVNGTDGTPVWIDAVATVFVRTNTSGVGVGPAPPTIPATVSAAVTPDVGSSKPTTANVNAAADLIAATINRTFG